MMFQFSVCYFSFLFYFNLDFCSESYAFAIVLLCFHLLLVCLVVALCFVRRATVCIDP